METENTVAKQRTHLLYDVDQLWLIVGMNRRLGLHRLLVILLKMMYVAYVSGMFMHTIFTSECCSGGVKLPKVCVEYQAKSQQSDFPLNVLLMSPDVSCLREIQDGGR